MALTAAEEQELAALDAEFREPESNVSPVTGKDVVRSAFTGLTFGFGDEISGAVEASVDSFTDDDDMTWKERYKKNRDYQRQETARFQEEHPVAATTSEIAGGLVTGLAGGARVATLKGAQKLASKIPVAMRGAGVGGAGGAVYGAGTAEELGDVPGSAAVGLGLGLGLGAFTQALGHYGTKFVKHVYNKVMSSPSGQGNRVLRDTLEEAGLDDAQVKKAMDDLGEDAILADVDPSTQHLLGGVSAVPGAGRGQIEKQLRARDAKQQEQLWNTAQEIAGNDGSVHASSKALAESQKRIAKPMYEEAYSQPVRPTPGLNEMLDKPWVQQAYQSGRKIARNDVDRAVDAPPGLGRPKVDAKMAEGIEQGVEPPLTTEEWDWIQRGLRQKADKASRAGAKDTARVAGGLRRELLGEVDQANPAFGQARKTYAGFESLKESMEYGLKALDNKVDIDELAEVVNDFGPADKQAFMIGISKHIKNKILGVSERRDISGIPLFQNPIIKEKLALVLGEEGAERLLKEVKKAETFKQTSNQVLKQSATAGRQATREQLDSGSLAGVGADIATGLPLALIGRQALKAASPGGVPRETAQSVAGALTSKSPDLSALAPTGPLGRTSLAMNPLLAPTLQGGAAVGIGGPLANRQRR